MITIICFHRIVCPIPSMFVLLDFDTKCDHSATTGEKDKFILLLLHATAKVLLDLGMSKHFCQTHLLKLICSLKLNWTFEPG